MRYRTYLTTEDERDEEWRFEFFNDRTISADPCPHCGSQGFWNAAWEVHGQFAQVAKDDERGDSALDSADSGKMQYIGCGNCGADLMRRGDSDLDPEKIPEEERRRNPDEPVVEDRVWRDDAPQFSAEDNPLVSDHAVTVRTVMTVDYELPMVSLAIHRERVGQQEFYHVTGRVNKEEHIKLGLHKTQKEANGELKRKQKELDFVERQ
jgi:hypothetical protein